MGLPVGTKVRVKTVTPEDETVAEHVRPYVGKVGVVKTPPDISGSQWVQFNDGGGVFYPHELEVIR